MKLFIAEKPSLARAIVAGLGGEPIKKSGYYIVGDAVVTSAVGHLLQLKAPEELNPDYEKWDMENLPMKLTPLQKKPYEKTEIQLKLIGSLLKKATVIINAGDPDEEGQLLIDEVLEYYGVDPDADNIYRVMINDLNINAVKKSLSRLTKNKEHVQMRDAAQARSGGDYIYGMNMTRAYTLAAQRAGYQGVLSVGRVQTAMFGLIVKRYRANQSFVPSVFYRVFAELQCHSGSLLAELVAPDDAPVDDKGRIINEDYAKALVSRLSGQRAKVIDVEKTQKSQAPAFPLSLLALQVRMGEKKGMGGEEVLKLVQSLYETHKAASYPRTDNKYISVEQWEAAKETLPAIAEMAPSLADAVAIADCTIKSKAVNDAKVSAHHAIIPVPTTAKSLSQKEESVYTEIARYYLAQFLPNKEINHIKAIFDVDGVKFISQGAKVVSRGWEMILDEGDDEGDGNGNMSSDVYEAISSLSEDSLLNINGFSNETGKTTPPAIYTESSLMKDLPQIRKYVESEKLREAFARRDKERGGDNAGIGTPATRSGIFENIKKRGYFEVKGKKLIPTKSGESFFDALPAIAVNPDITALWSIQQERIADKELTVSDFYEQIESFVEKQITNVKENGVEIAAYKCPNCDKLLRRLKGSNGVFWACSGYRDEPQCKTAFPDYHGEPDIEGKGKAKVEAKKAREIKKTTCPNCKRRLKRLKDKKEEGKYFWACEGVFDESNPCKSFFPEEKGMPLLKKKDK